MGFAIKPFDAAMECLPVIGINFSLYRKSQLKKTFMKPPGDHNDLHKFTFILDKAQLTDLHPDTIAEIKETIPKVNAHFKCIFINFLITAATIAIFSHLGLIAGSSFTIGRLIAPFVSTPFALWSAAAKAKSTAATVIFLALILLGIADNVRINTKSLNIISNETERLQANEVRFVFG